jgi:hypothetical protein
VPVFVGGNSHISVWMFSLAHLLTQNE